MKGFLDWVQSIAATLGAPGLFIIGFLDSSFLSFPEVNDLLLVLMVTRHPERMPLYAACATLGRFTAQRVSDWRSARAWVSDQPRMHAKSLGEPSTRAWTRPRASGNDAPPAVERRRELPARCYQVSTESEASHGMGLQH